MVARLFLFLLILHMSKQLLKFLCLLFIMQILFHVETFSQLKNDFGYQGTIEIKVGETKTIWLIDKVQGMISLSTTYYPSGKWVLSNNFYNATMMSQSMQYCKVRGDKKGDNIKLTFSGNMILYDAMWEYTGYYYIKVVESDVKVTSISVSPSTTSLTVGGTKQLSATVSPSNATNKSVSWSSSNTSIATVSSSGLVTAKAAGSATITCKANDGSGKYATCSVKVEAIKVTEVRLNYTSVPMKIGDTKQLTATISPSNATDKSVTWSSSNTSVAKVSNTGLVTAVSEGTATITCKANDGSGKSATCSIPVSSALVAEINATNFPDSEFRKYLLSQDYGEDGKLTETEISKVTSISVSGKSSSEPGNIKSLKGIEYFTALKYLYCGNNQLTTLDISKNTALTSLFCYNNKFTTLDVSKLTALTYLSCSSNQLTSLDVSRLTALTYLSCDNNQLTSLDVSRLTALTSLSCSSNQLTSLDVSRLTALTDLWCGKNQLTSLDVSRLTALTYLSCYNNQLTSLDVSKLTALTSLHCGDNQLTSLDVSKLTALKSLSCDNNQLTSLDVSRLTALTSLSCYNNQLTSLDVSQLTALTSLSCGKNQLTSLDVSQLTALTSLSCGDNQLTSLDVSRLTALTYLSCDKNQLTSLDVSKLTALTSLSCGKNQLTSLDVSRLTALTYLSCGSNQLTSLDVTRLTALTYLSCYNNQLTSLDVSKLTALTYLSCENNHLTSLDVSRLTALTRLYCSTNQLTSLDVSKLTALTSLYCNTNQLTSLDVSKLTSLTSLFCSRNQLTSLDVSKLTALTYLSCGSNQLTSLDVSKLTALTSLDCGSNQLTSLDVSKLTVLQDLYCYNNQLSALDVSENKSLKLLSCYYNSIEGTSMDNLISSLPQNNTTDIHRFEVVRQDLSKEGNVCTVMQVAAVKAKGWFPCYYDSTTREYVEYKGSDKASTTKGDVNGDNQVNGTDLVALTNIILGKNAKTDAADVNGDGQVNGTDYVALVNIVLGRSQAPRRAATDAASLSIDPSFDIKAGETKEMVINLTNPNDEITLVQFDLSLPNGLSVKQTGGEYVYDIADRTTWRKHSLEANATGGIIRFLLASSSNATLSGTEGAIITITLNADNTYKGGTVKLENILLVTPDEKEIKPADLSYTIGSTDISSITTDAIDSNTPIYNLRGQRLAAPQKGINIIGGKKVIVK